MQKPNSLSPGFAAFVPPVLVVLAVAAAYSNSFSGPFVLDDLPSIAANPSIRGWETALSTPVQSSTHGRPLLNLSFALNYAVSGQSVWSYHLLNLIIHAGCALVLYGIVRRTLQALAHPDAAALAAWSALVWAVHPLATGAVTYTVQRAESLMGLFMLLTVYCLARSARGDSRHGSIFGLLSVGCCFLGMATKEVMAVAPAIALLYDRTFIAGSFGAALRLRWRLYCGFAAGWLLLAALVVSTHGRGGTAGFGSGVSVWAYGLTQLHAIVHYLRLCFYPHPLVFYYGSGVITEASSVLPETILVAGLLGATIWALLKSPGLGFLGVTFFLILAPSSSFMPVATETMAEHRMYLPLIPVVVLAVLGIRRWLGPRDLWLLAPLAACLVGATFCRNRSYGSALRLWGDTVADAPGNPWAHNNLGCELDSVPGRSGEAMAQYEIALRLKPDHAEAHYNLANDLRLIPGRMDEAIVHYEAAVRSNPSFPKAQNNLASALLGIPGRVEEAIAHYQDAVRLNPGYAEAHFNLGNAWLKVPGRESDAIAEYREALRIRPNYPEVHNSLGRILADNPATVPDAVEQFQRAIQINPGYAEARYNLGTVWSGIAERRDDAVIQLREAIRLRPDYAEARNNLGNLWAVTPGHWADAIAEYRRALEIRPDYAEGHYNLAVALLRQPGNEDEAKAQLQAYLKLAPDNEDARRLLESLKGPG